MVYYKRHENHCEILRYIFTEIHAVFSNERTWKLQRCTILSRDSLCTPSESILNIIKIYKDSLQTHPHTYICFGISWNSIG